MMLSFAVAVIILTFCVQLFLCFCATKRWIRLIPLCLIAAGELLCAAGYLLLDHVYGAAFAAVIYAVVFLIVLVGDVFAWLLYFIVRKAQKAK